MKLPIADLLIDQSIQIRTRLDEDTVADYVEQLDVSEPPPVIVFDVAHILADGFHRVEAAQRAGRRTVEAEERPGGREDAEAYAIVANAKGRALRLTRAERNVGIRRLLDMGWTTRRVATEMGVAKETVANIGHERRVTASLPPDLAASDVLTPTHRYRIAMLPPAMQEPVARVVHDEGLSEPETRELIRDLRAAPVNVEGATRDDVMRHVKGEVRRLMDADPLVALHQVTKAMFHLRELVVEDVLAAIPPGEASVLAMQLDDLLDYFTRIREGLERASIRSVS